MLRTTTKVLFLLIAKRHESTVPFDNYIKEKQRRNGTESVMLLWIKYEESEELLVPEV